MTKTLLIFVTFLALAIAANQPVAAQTADENKNKTETCDGPIYKGSEVTKKAKIKRMVEPDIPLDVFMKVKGVVQIRAVLCATGKVTNIEVIHGMPFGITELVIKALMKTKFRPAEKDGQPVSQYLIRELQLDGVRN